MDKQVSGGNTTQMRLRRRLPQENRQFGVCHKTAAKGDESPLGLLGHIPIGQLPGHHHVQMAQIGGNRTGDARMEQGGGMVFRNQKLGALGGAHLAHAADGGDDLLSVQGAGIAKQAGTVHLLCIFQPGQDVFQFHIHGGNDGDHRILLICSNNQSTPVQTGRRHRPDRPR